MPFFIDHLVKKYLNSNRKHVYLFCLLYMTKSYQSLETFKMIVSKSMNVYPIFNIILTNIEVRLFYRQVCSVLKAWLWNTVLLLDHWKVLKQYHDTAMLTVKGQISFLQQSPDTRPVTFAGAVQAGAEIS